MSENIIHIHWDRGQMMLVIDKFFPCKIRDARKVMPLIAEGSSDEDIEKLERFLQGTVRDFEDAADYQREEIETGTIPEWQVKRARRQIKSCGVMAKRAKRNLQILEGLL